MSTQPIPFRAAAIQMDTGPDFTANMARATALVEQAAASGARLVALPENFSFLRTRRDIPHRAHTLESPFVSELRSLADRLDIYLLAGSFHERVSGSDRLYNTSLLIGPDGRILARYRKLHLFDIDLPGGASFRESAHFAPGDEVVVQTTALGIMGLSICYDLRFPELYRRLAALGAQIIFVPAAFTYATGRDHWEILLRARAIENLCYVIAPALVGQPSPRIHNYGHAQIIDPWGTVLAGAGDRETVIMADIDLSFLAEKRRQLPALEHGRRDLLPSGAPGRTQNGKPE